MWLSDSWCITGICHMCEGRRGEGWIRWERCRNKIVLNGFDRNIMKYESFIHIYIYITIYI